QSRDALRLVPPTLGKAREGTSHKTALCERWLSKAIEPPTVDAKLPAPIGPSVVVVEPSEIDRLAIEPELFGVSSRALGHRLPMGAKRDFNVLKRAALLLSRQRFDYDAVGPPAHTVAVDVSIDVVVPLDGPAGTSAVGFVAKIGDRGSRRR